MEPADMLEITVWDVNHGSAVYIKTPNNRHIVVDLGDGDKFSPLQTLYSQGVQQLDAVVITHPHRDHLDDIFNLSLLSPKSLWWPKSLTPQEIFRGNRTEDSVVVKRYLQLLQEFTAPLTPDNVLPAPANFGGARFDVFAPYWCSSENLNDRSLVVVASYAGLKMVIPGDNESPSWKELLRDTKFVAAVSGAHILFASHHGREAGYCSELFDAMGQPKLVVVSDGAFGDTSATSRYSNHANGWEVFDAAGSSDIRYCLTTRCDGHITIKLGWIANRPENGNFLNVTTSKVSVAKLVTRHVGF
jgi:beta-lactamase superfamily II metal-dependent hydrolase